MSSSSSHVPLKERSGRSVISVGGTLLLTTGFCIIATSLISSPWSSSQQNLNNFFLEDNPSLVDNEAPSLKYVQKEKRNRRRSRRHPQAEKRRYQHAAVASEAAVCSKLGTEILKDGGSAVDSAIGTSLCVGAVNNFATGIGGGGFMIVRTPSGEAEVLDYRETAPLKTDPKVYQKNPKLSSVGPLSIAVPGEIRGFEQAHKQYGKMPWAEIFDRVATLNENGFRVTNKMAYQLEANSEWIMRDPVWAREFAPNGKLVVEGEILVRTKLAKALRLIADQGPDAFYKGAIGESIVRAVQEAGGVLSMEDLASYEPIWRKPLVSKYRDLDILTLPPPASGAVLSHIFNILEHAQLYENGKTGLSYHRLIEAFRFGYAKRSLIADPDFANMDKVLHDMLSHERTAEALHKIYDSHTLDPYEYGADFDTVPNHGTTHLSVIDEDGMAVGMTDTINYYFGSHIMDPNFSVILNCQMDDFSVPGTPNIWDLPASPANFMKPGKRPVSSSSATILVRDNKVEMVVGASGGSRIISAVASVIVNYFDFGMPLVNAVSAPRIHNQLFPNINLADHGFPRSVAESLVEKEHNLKYTPVGACLDVVQAVVRHPDGTLSAMSDYRKKGKAAGY